jgi:hypothetical protein
MKESYEKAKLKLQPPNPHERQLREKAAAFHVKEQTRVAMHPVRLQQALERQSDFAPHDD